MAQIVYHVSYICKQHHNSVHYEYLHHRRQLLKTHYLLQHPNQKMIYNDQYENFEDSLDHDDYKDELLHTL
jgi:hypothetical protein